MRKCKQCGEIQQQEQFRKYYGAKGRYKVCLTCEKINNRYKYLKRKGDKCTEADVKEILKIEQMYALLRDKGLEPPERRDDNSVLDLVDSIMATAAERPDPEPADTLPEELQRWLDADLQGEDPENLQAIADRLWETYRPQTGVDQRNNYKPIYDDTYREELLMIQEKFDSYEDEFYS